jgi:hypothetical protein
MFPFEEQIIPLDDWIGSFIDWLVDWATAGFFRPSNGRWR